MKKHIRKLFPVVSLLLVAVVLTTTASFAWFTMNDQVEVTGIDMKAVAAGDLLVAPTFESRGPDVRTPADEFRSALDLGEHYDYSDVALRPASSLNGVSFIAWRGNTAAFPPAEIPVVTSAVTTDEGSIITIEEIPTWNATEWYPAEVPADEPTIDPNTNESYGYYADFALSFRTQEGAEAAVGLQSASINVVGLTTAERDLASAFRIAFLTADGAALAGGNNVFAVNWDTGAGHLRGPISTLPDSTNTAHLGVEATPLVTVGEGVGTPTTLFTIPAVTANETGIVDIIVRVWIEGQSAAAINLNAGLSVNFDLVFTIIP